MGTNLELSGKFKSTTKGNIDWYYGGGEEAWANRAAALAGVPTVLRLGKTVAYPVSGVVTEFIWKAGVADVDLVEKNVEERPFAIDVRKYGAKCDGITDDTAAVQAALDNNLLVFFPENTTTIVSSDLLIKSNQTIFF